jgi:hypothetical protein
MTIVTNRAMRPGKSIETKVRKRIPITPASSATSSWGGIPTVAPSAIRSSSLFSQRAPISRALASRASSFGRPFAPAFASPRPERYMDACVTD